MYRPEKTPNLSRAFAEGVQAQIAGVALGANPLTDTGEKEAWSAGHYAATGPAAWAGSTAYVRGQVVTNDTPTRCYLCITDGTSAGSGGPTDKSPRIDDTGVTWQYICDGSTFDLGVHSRAGLDPVCV